MKGYWKIRKNVQSAEEKPRRARGDTPKNSGSRGYRTGNNQILGYPSQEEDNSWGRRRARPDGVHITFRKDRGGEEVS